MKSLYLLGLMVGLLWVALGVVVTVATPPEEGLAIQLSREPEKWELRIIEESYFLKKSEEKQYNELIRKFISKNRRASEARRNDIDTAVAIGCVFCALGWFREKRNEKKKGA